MAAITVRAFAKINLTLRIMGKRPDGFHEVVTILQSIDLADRLTCRTRKGPFEILCKTPGVPTDRSNLVWRAAERLWTAGGRAGEPKDTVVTIDKKIPMQAGLGGGSTDAAAALLALRTLWKLRVGDEVLVSIGAALGSDVPFFFVGGTALGIGRGEDVYPLATLPRLWVVLVRPSFGVPTADAYRWLAESRAAGAPPKPGAVRYLEGTWLGRTTPLVNDLEGPVAGHHPEIGRLTARLAELGARHAAMSGSGSTVYGVFTTAKAAAAAAGKLRRSGENVLVARMRSR